MAAPGQDRVERRLAAILAADVAGYSCLTGLDEEGTHAQFQDHLRSLVAKLMGGATGGGSLCQPSPPRRSSRQG